MNSPAVLTKGDVDAGDIIITSFSSTIGAAARVDELAYTPIIAFTPFTSISFLAASAAVAGSVAESSSMS